MSVDERLIILGQFLRRHGQVGIQNHQQVTFGLLETLAHRVTFAPFGLLQYFDPVFGIGLLDSLNLIPSVIRRPSLDKNKLRPFTHRGSTSDRSFDIAGFISSRDQYGHTQVLLDRVSVRTGTRDEKHGHTEPGE